MGPSCCRRHPAPPRRDRTPGAAPPAAHPHSTHRPLPHRCAQVRVRNKSGREAVSRFRGGSCYPPGVAHGEEAPAPPVLLPHTNIEQVQPISCPPSEKPEGEKGADAQRRSGEPPNSLPGGAASPAPLPRVCLFPGRSWPFMSGKINRQLRLAAETRREGGELGGGHAAHPPAALGHFIDNQEGSKKEKEKKEVKTALLLAAGSKRPPSLPSSFFVRRCRRVARGWQVRDPDAPQPGQGEHPPSFWGRQQQAGARQLGAQWCLLRTAICSDSTKLPPRQAPAKPLTPWVPSAQGRALLPPCCVGGGHDRAGVTWV